MIHAVFEITGFLFWFAIIGYTVSLPIAALIIWLFGQKE